MIFKKSIRKVVKARDKLFFFINYKYVANFLTLFKSFDIEHRSMKNM